MSSNPGQQLDEQIAALTAKLNAHIKATSEAIEDIMGELQTHADIIYDMLPPDPIDPPVDPPVDPTPIDPPATGVPLAPGDGWDGPTEIAEGPDPAIAHWNVVPEQTIGNWFTVGVIAHHLDGVDFVDIGANGSWQTATLGINPRTKCEEWYVTLDTSSFLGDAIELRAIVIDKNGFETLVEPIGSTYSEQDLTLYTKPTGKVVELAPGNHKIRRQDLPENGWLIYRGTRDAIITDIERDWQNGRVKFEGVTLKLGSRSRIQAKWASTPRNRHVWLDNCRIIGNGPSDPTYYLTKFWETTSVTDCEISDMQSVFDDGEMLVRNCDVHDIYEDVCRVDGLYVNLTVSNVDRTPASNDYHPDVLQDQHVRGTIMQDVVAVDNVNAQGFFPKDVTGCALVRVNMRSSGGFKSMQVMGMVDNLLIKDSQFSGTPLLRGSVDGRLVVDNTPTVQWQGISGVETR